MPLTSAIQSAMAVRMEREKRHQRRLSKIRRESGVGGAGQSIICTKRQSVGSVATTEGEEEVEVRAPPDKSDSWVTTFHMGIVFILLGFIMIFSSMIPTSLIKADWSRLLGVGVAFIFIGLIMVMVNRIITAREEEELSKYVSHRLSRTRSGQAVVRDPEQGSMVVPDIVKPPIPSILKDHNSIKGAGGHHPPRSPKDKVTFAEFNDIAHSCGDTSSEVKITEFSSSLDVPSEANGKVIILEPLEDSKSSQCQEERETLLCQATPD